MEEPKALIQTVLSAARQGASYGAKIRLPHALVMTFLFQKGTLESKIKRIVQVTFLVEGRGCCKSFLQATAENRVWMVPFIFSPPCHRLQPHPKPYPHPTLNPALRSLSSWRWPTPKTWPFTPARTKQCWQFSGCFNSSPNREGLLGPEPRRRLERRWRHGTPSWLEA